MDILKNRGFVKGCVFPCILLCGLIIAICKAPQRNTQDKMLSKFFIASEDKNPPIIKTINDDSYLCGKNKIVFSLKGDEEKIIKAFEEIAKFLPKKDEIIVVSKSNATYITPYKTTIFSSPSVNVGYGEIIVFCDKEAFKQAYQLAKEIKADKSIKI